MRSYHVLATRLHVSSAINVINVVIHVVNVVTGLVLKSKEVEVRLIVGNMILVLIVGAMERDVWLVLLAIFAVRARMNIGGPMASHHVGKRIAGVKVPVVSEVHHAIVVAVVQNGSGAGLDIFANDIT